MVVDGVESKDLLASEGTLQFSPDSKRFAFRMESLADGWQVFVEGAQGKWRLLSSTNYERFTFDGPDHLWGISAYMETTDVIKELCRVEVRVVKQR